MPGTEDFSTKDSSLSDLGLANTCVITSMLLLRNGLCQEARMINIHIYTLFSRNIITLNINGALRDVGSFGTAYRTHLIFNFLSRFIAHFPRRLSELIQFFVTLSCHKVLQNYTSCYTTTRTVASQN